MPSAGGFSLIELLVSAAILGVLASVALPLAEMTSKRERERELRTALRDIREALDAYKRAGVEGRIPIQQGASGYPPALDALVMGVVDVKDPGGRMLYFLRRVPRDPFFNNRAVPAAETWGKRSYASPPDSPKPGDDVYDVYSLSSDVGMNGVPYSEW